MFIATLSSPGKEAGFDFDIFKFLFLYENQKLIRINKA